MYKLLNNKVLLFIIAALLLSNIAMFLFLLRMKQPWARDLHGGNQKYPITVFLDKQIGFSKEQLDQYEKIRQNHRQKMRPLFEDIRLAKVQFYSQLSKPSTESDSMLKQAASGIAEKQTAIDQQAFKNFKEIRTLCNDDQKVMYDSLISGVISKMWFPMRKPMSSERK